MPAGEMEPLHALLVDVGGTIWPEHGPLYTVESRVRRFRTLFPDLSERDIERVVEALDAPTRGWESPTVVEQDSYALVDRVLIELGMTDLSNDAVRHAMYVPASVGGNLFDDADLLFRTARELGLRTVVVSNTAWRRAEDYRRDFEHLGVADFIDGIVTSLDVGYRKPHDQIFRVSIEMAQCDASRCAFVGDSEEKDIAPARERGMRTILVAIEQSPPEKTTADVVARSMRDVTETISEWATRSR